MQSAFQFALTDRMSLNDKDLVQVITSIDGSHGVRSLRTVYAEKILYPLNETVLSKLFASPKESSSDVYISVEVRTWSPSLRMAEDVRTKVIFLSFNVIRMLHLVSLKTILGSPIPSNFTLILYSFLLFRSSLPLEP